MIRVFEFDEQNKNACQTKMSLGFVHHAQKKSTHVKDSRNKNDTIHRTRHLAQPSMKPSTPGTTNQSLQCSDFVVIMYNCLSVLTFIVIIATGAPFLETFSISKQVVGIVVGLFPIISAIMHFPIRFLLRRYSIRLLGIVFCFVNIIGYLLYGFAGAARSEAMIFAGRVVNGLVVSPLLPGVYISRRFTTITANQNAQRWFAVLSVVSYVIGSLIAAANEGVWNATYPPTGSREVFTIYTVPAWVLVVIGALLMVLFFCVDDVPPKRTTMFAPTRSRLGIVCGWICTSMLSMSFAVWNVHIVYESYKRWDWPMLYVLLYVAGVTAVSTPLFFCVPTNRPLGSIIVSSFITIVGGVLSIRYNVTRAIDIAIFTIGSIAISSSTMLRRKDSFFLANDGGSWKGTNVTINSALFMLFLGIGACIAPFVQSYFGECIIIFSAIELVTSTLTAVVDR